MRCHAGTMPSIQLLRRPGASWGVQGRPFTFGGRTYMQVSGLLAATMLALQRLSCKGLTSYMASYFPQVRDSSWAIRFNAFVTALIERVNQRSPALPWQRPYIHSCFALALGHPFVRSLVHPSIPQLQLQQRESSGSHFVSLVRAAQGVPFGFEQLSSANCLQAGRNGRCSGANSQTDVLELPFGSSQCSP
jgi:hypothetical protein